MSSKRVEPPEVEFAHAMEFQRPLKAGNWVRDPNYYNPQIEYNVEEEKSYEPPAEAGSGGGAMEEDKPILPFRRSFRQNRMYYRRYKKRKYRSAADREAYAQAKAVVAAAGWEDRKKRYSDESVAKYGKTWGMASPAQKAMRISNRFYGDGDYMDVLRGVGKYASRGIGALAGGATAMMGGSSLGNLVEAAKSGWDTGAAFSRYMGWGDYSPTTSTNQLVGDGVSGPMSTISVNKENASGDLIVTQSEFIGNVIASATGAGSSPFQLVKYAINPALSSSFPFLSQIAENYELYDFEGLMYQYKPTSGESGASSNSLGKVVMATNYDPDAEDFQNSTQMENYDYSCATKPSLGLIHGVETKPLASSVNMFYCRSGSSTKPKFATDLGNFYLATEGIPFSAAGSQIVGELWVAYRVRLSRAKLYGSQLGKNISVDVFNGTAGLSDFALTAVAKQSNQIGLTITPVSATEFTVKFPTNISLGAYFVCFRAILGAGAATLMAAPRTLVNCQIGYPGLFVPSSTDPSTSYSYAPNNAAATNTYIQEAFVVQVTSPGILQASFNLRCQAALPASTTWNLIVTEFNQSSLNSVA